MPSFESLNTYQRANFIVQYVTIIINIFGIIGNILLICVLSRKSMRKYSYSFFSIAKSIVDTVVLVYAFRNWARFNYDTNLDIINAPICIIFNRFIVYITFFMGVVFLPLISIDRLVTIVYPNRFGFFKKLWFQWLLVVIVFVYSVLFNIILPLNTNLIYTPSGAKICSLVFSEFTKHSWMQVGNIVGFILILNTAVNIKLIWHIKSSRRRVELKKKSDSTRTSQRDRKFAITSIGLCLMAFFFKLPTAIVIIVTNKLNLDMDLFALLFAVSILVFDIDCASAFYINMLLNPMFVREFKVMIFRIKRNTEASTAMDGTSNTVSKTFEIQKSHIK